MEFTPSAPDGLLGAVRARLSALGRLPRLRVFGAGSWIGVCCGKTRAEPPPPALLLGGEEGTRGESPPGSC